MLKKMLLGMAVCVFSLLGVRDAFSSSTLNLSLQNSQAGNIFYIKEPVKIGFKIKSRSNEIKSLDVHYSVRDYSNKELHKGDKEIEVKAKETLSKWIDVFPSGHKKRGFFTFPRIQETNNSSSKHTYKRNKS